MAPMNFGSTDSSSLDRGYLVIVYSEDGVNMNIISYSWPYV